MAEPDSDPDSDVELEEIEEPQPPSELPPELPPELTPEPLWKTSSRSVLRAAYRIVPSGGTAGSRSAAYGSFGRGPGPRKRNGRQGREHNDLRERARRSTRAKERSL